MPNALNAYNQCPTSKGQSEFRKDQALKRYIWICGICVLELKSIIEEILRLNRKDSKALGKPESYRGIKDPEVIASRLDMLTGRVKYKEFAVLVDISWFQFCKKACGVEEVNAQ